MREIKTHVRRIDGFIELRGIDNIFDASGVVSPPFLHSEMPDHENVRCDLPYGVI